jgi:uncharacterized protein (TIGR04255 family)
MAEQKRLRNPPVSEAVVDIHVEFSNPNESLSFSKIRDRIASDYPEEKLLHDLELNVQLGPELSKPENRSQLVPSGLMFVSSDKKQVVQCKKAGLTFSRLAPYGTWEQTIGETMKLWRLYVELFSPSKVTRVSTRFINKLALPGLSPDLDDYLLIAPKTPHGVPAMVSRFMTMVTLPVADRTVAHLRCLFEGQSQSDAIPVVLDIDIIRECMCAASDEKGVLAQINELRPIKNAVFFGSLTDKTVELYT